VLSNQPKKQIQVKKRMNLVTKLNCHIAWLVYMMYSMSPVSQLRKCVHDPLHVINFELLDIQANLTYKELRVKNFGSQGATVEIEDYSIGHSLMEIETMEWKLD
jgi:hypothetical protein